MTNVILLAMLTGATWLVYKGLNAVSETEADDAPAEVLEETEYL